MRRETREAPNILNFVFKVHNPNTCMFSLRTSLVSYTTLHLMLLLSLLTTNTLEQLITYYTQLTATYNTQKPSLQYFYILSLICCYFLLRLSTTQNPHWLSIITNMSFIALLLLLCLSSLHACNSRLISSTKVYHFAQDAEEVQLFETSSKSKLLKASIAVLEYQTPKEAKNIIDERIKPENCDGATTPTQKVLLRKQLQLADEESSGSGITKSFGHIELQQQSIKEKGLSIKGNDQRSLLESAPHDTEEALDFKENDSVDDVVVMDYAQPHRKPPIHNEKP